MIREVADGKFLEPPILWKEVWFGFSISFSFHVRLCRILLSTNNSVSRPSTSLIVRMQSFLCCLTLNDFVCSASNLRCRVFGHHSLSYKFPCEILITTKCFNEQLQNNTNTLWHHKCIFSVYRRELGAV